MVIGMNKVQLKNYVALARTLNFSTAAKQQFISQSALTKQIHRLEGELGVALFHRTKHGVSLTFAGEQFYSYARDIIMGMEQAEQRMEQISKGHIGSLNISSVLGMENIVSDSIAQFSRKYSDVSINIRCGSDTQQIMDMNKKACDVYFSVSTLLKSVPHVESISLPEDRFAVYVNKTDAAMIETEGLSHLNKFTKLIEPYAEASFLMPRVFALLDALNLNRDNVSCQASLSTIIIAIQTGQGFSLLPSQINFGLMPDNIVKIPLDCPEAVIEQALGWHQGSQNIAVKNFVDIVCGRNMLP